MLKKYRKIFIVVFVLIQCFSFNAFATNENMVLQDCNITIEEFESLEHSYASYDTSSSRATGLIISQSLAIAKSGNNLIITGKTVGDENKVIKCGFETLTVERRANSTASWSEYCSYSNLYDSDNSYTLSKSVAVDSGYQYRVTGEHRAYEGWFTYQSINGTTDPIQF